MARAFPIITAFTAGELSPRLWGRVDIDKYRDGVKTLENMSVYPQGGATRRWGSAFVAPVKNTTHKVRLDSFEFSDDEAYVLEIGDLYIRFYANGAQVLNGGVPAEVVTPYLIAQAFALQLAQVADVMTIAHPSHCPRELVRTSATAFSLSRVDFIDGPYLSQNINSEGEASTVTITPSATSGSVTLTASADFFAATDTTGSGGIGDMDRLIRLKDGDIWVWAKITAYTSATVVTATIEDGATLSGLTPIATWRLGAFSSTSGFPAAVAFFEQRRVFGATALQPQRLWASAIDDYANYSPDDVTDDDAWTYALAANKANGVRWVADGSDALFAGTVGAEWKVSANPPPITPSNVSARPQTYEGVAAVQPINAKEALVFLQKDNRRLMALAFDLAADKEVADDLTLLAEHATEGGLAQLAYSNAPEPIIWAVRNDGQLLGLTYMPRQKVLAMHRHILGGGFSGGAAVVESIAVIPVVVDGVGRDQVWLSVKRTVDGTTQRYVEYLDPDRFCDSSLVTTGPASSVSGLGHLEGESVAVRVDGAALAEKTVVDGAVDLGGEYTDIQVGLPFTHKLHPLPPEVGAQAGAAIGQRRQIFKMGLFLLRSLGSEINGEPIILRSSSDPMDAPPPLFTGWYITSVDHGWENDLDIRIEGSQPLPFTLNCITFGQNVSEG